MELDRKYVPPWKEPYIIALAGSSGSGKTSIAQTIIKRLNVPWTILLSMDNFYKPLEPAQIQLAFESRYDFDSPDAIDLDLFVEVLTSLKRGERARIPNYSFAHHNRTDHWTTVYGANVIIIEGIYALHDERVLALTDLRIFVDTALDVCLARRLSRDIVYRGREIALSVVQWQRFVKPNFEQHVRHTMYKADVRIPRGIDNTVALDMLVAHIQRQLAKKSARHLNHFLALSGQRRGSAASDLSEPLEEPLPHNVILIEQTSQVRGMHTILLASATDDNHSRADFIFYFDRIASLIVTRALDEFAYGENSIVTPTGHTYQGVVPTSLPAAVELIRGGQCFERSLRKTLPALPIGKILIQSDARTGEPHLHTLKLPPCLDPRLEFCPSSAESSAPSSSSSALSPIPVHMATTITPLSATSSRSGCSINEEDLAAQAQTKILLCEAQMASGAAVTMSVAILQDHGVREENIIIISYLASEIAVRRISAAFPRVTIVVGLVTPKIYPRFVDNAYFGTM